MVGGRQGELLMKELEVERQVEGASLKEICQNVRNGVLERNRKLDSYRESWLVGKRDKGSKRIGCLTYFSSECSLRRTSGAIHWGCITMKKKKMKKNRAMTKLDQSLLPFPFQCLTSSMSPASTERAQNHQPVK